MQSGGPWKDFQITQQITLTYRYPQGNLPPEASSPRTKQHHLGNVSTPSSSNPLPLQKSGKQGEQEEE